MLIPYFAVLFLSVLTEVKTYRVYLFLEGTYFLIEFKKSVKFVKEKGTNI